MFCKYCGQEIEDGAESCQHCGRKLKTEKGAGPGKAEARSARTVTLSMRWVIAIVIIVVAVIVLVSVLATVRGRNRGATAENEVVSTVQPHLSSANVQIAEDVIDIANQYLDGEIQYASVAVDQVEKEIAIFNMPNENDASYLLSLQAYICMNKVETELVKFEITNMGGNLIYGDVSHGDNEKVLQCCNELAKIAGIS